MLNTDRAHILLARGLLLFIALMLCMSLCVLAAVPAEADDPWTYLEGSSDHTEVTGIKSGVTVPETLEIPDGVKKIADCAFSTVKGIKKVIFPSGSITIGNNAFMYCNDITEVIIPKGATVGTLAFSYCENLTTVKVLYGRATIKSGAFSNCPKLSRVELASDVSFSGNSAFADATALTIYYDGVKNNDVGDSHVSWKAPLPADSEAAYEYMSADSKLTVVKYRGTSAEPEVPDTINGKAVTHIAKDAFTSTTPVVTSVSLPASVKEIEEGALPNTKVTLKGYNPAASEYAESKDNVKFVDLNLTELHTVTVAPGFESWLSVTYGPESADVDSYFGSDQQKQSLELTPLHSDTEKNQVTVWIDTMNTDSQLLEKIFVNADPMKAEPGDESFSTEESVFVIIAKAQSQLTEDDTCVPKRLRRFTFDMPGANIIVSGDLIPLANGPTMPTTPAAQGGADQESLAGP